MGVELLDIRRTVHEMYGQALLYWIKVTEQWWEAHREGVLDTDTIARRIKETERKCFMYSR